MFISSVIIWAKSQSLTDTQNEIKTDDVPGVIYYMQLNATLAEIETHLLSYLAGEEESKHAFYQAHKRFNLVLSDLKPLESATISDREKIQKVSDLSREIKSQAHTHIFNIYNPSMQKSAFSAVDKLENQQVAQISKLLKRLKQQEFEDAMRSADLQETLADDLPGVKLYFELYSAQAMMIASLTEYITGEVDEKGSFEQASIQFKKHLTALKPLENKRQEIDDLAQVEKLFEAIYQHAQSVFAQYDPSVSVQAKQVVRQLRQVQFKELKTILNRSSEEEKNDSIQALITLSAGMSLMGSTIVIATCIAALLSMLIAYKLSHSISNRLNTLLTVSKQTANGNISTTKLEPKGRDEIDDLAHASNDMTSSLNSLITQIGQLAGLVNIASKEIARSNDSISTRSQASSEQSTLIATAIEEMSTSIADVARQSQDANTQASQAKELALQGGKVVDQTISEIDDASQAVQKTSEQVINLGELGAQIEEVMGVISSIAEQTNLLALNAAIEAARAGEQGRGFSVVADEVRTLAERTSQATNQIVETVQTIQQQTTQAVNAMQNSVDKVSGCVHSAQQAGNSLYAIVDSATSIADMVQSIATATEEQSVVSREMALEVVKIEESSKSTFDDTQLASVEANKLAEQAQALSSSVGQFKLR
ncbi:methyl-accepting chemotaxis protein [Pseudoalteromonas luteoviolacea]|uniref:Methyl-accepting chemotaxis protein n=1 Tax=Pseudoalteromonas luteoviolacea S4054 TaxID=1129367 RepID=A0A0F6A846_9GAMM|nr:methyl-accepting chemotaxis protein [Pseudoalteromonas luteoviolacea]AOT10664.1 hypothetical protein S4054249_22660 [Pseudoalteromonas luteoviolacea]AOT15268.1 hypothetical protein S40542_20935 [Pseudoalteromonas luteoviolacea]AOT20483.1 hypothetical protein S4054_22575 [Pseudoalteromonas luteoviolacea]KKE82031.1 hypothetical protein N479_19980 [Pseudoalteromonas luteoviolacea S4054]KZN67750.1 hypothetical protein N481_23935 [Pseudoalteromonas luteoviolacea S4047-1]